MSMVQTAAAGCVLVSVYTNRIYADHVHPFMSKVHQLLMGVSSRQLTCTKLG